MIPGRRTKIPHAVGCGQNQKQEQNRGMDKEDVTYIFYTHTHTHTHTHTTESYSAIKKNEILPFVITWMDLESIMLSEISHTEKDKYCMILLTCGI